MPTRLHWPYADMDQTQSLNDENTSSVTARGVATDATRRINVVSH